MGVKNWPFIMDVGAKALRQVGWMDSGQCMSSSGFNMPSELQFLWLLAD